MFVEIYIRTYVKDPISKDFIIYHSSTQICLYIYYFRKMDPKSKSHIDYTNKTNRVSQADTELVQA